jgi:hypothetical protein
MVKFEFDDSGVYRNTNVSINFSNLQKRIGGMIEQFSKYLKI